MCLALLDWGDDSMVSIASRSCPFGPVGALPPAQRPRFIFVMRINGARV